MRPRKHDRHLPACMYLRGQSYYLVKRGKWENLGRDYTAALREYAQRRSHDAGTMGGLITEMMPHILRGSRGKPLATSTAKQYAYAGAQLAQVFAEFRPDQVRPSHVRLMLDTRGRESLALANRMLSVLRLVFDQAVMRDLVQVNPCASIHKLHHAPRDRLITLAEVDAIKSHSTARMQALIDLCVLTGQRVGDILAIRLADLTPDGIAITQQKTGVRLVVAWSDQIRAAVDLARSTARTVHGLTLFQGRRGVPWAYHHAWRLWDASCKAAGVENAKIHDLRALAATLAEAQGLDAKSLLGHTDARMTRRYLRDRTPQVVQGPEVGAKGAVLEKTAEYWKQGKKSRSSR